MTHTLPLVVRSDLQTIGDPFAGDLLCRDQIAKTLTGYVDRLASGAVIGISAPWGEGKTWFGRHWCAQLRSTHKVAFIDAFENDYLDDPFLLVASELADLLKEEGVEEVIRSRATEVFKAIVPVGTKAIINLLGRVLVGSAGLGDALAESGKDLSDSVADKSEQWLESRFNDLSSQRSSLQGFRSTLAEVAQRQERPVVVFIDELDRCKPSFAVTLIERLKHLFDVPNLVFVLLLNRTQLERSIEGHYGAGTDGRTYLGKFVNLWFDLPRPRFSRDEPDRRMTSFVEASLAGFKVPPQKRAEAESFRDECALWAQLWGLSLRDVERMCTLFVLDGMSGRPLPTYLIAMKVKDAYMFARLRTMEKAAHLECAASLESLCPQLEDGQELLYPETLYRSLADFHRVLVNDITIENASTLRKWGREIIGNFRNADRAFKVIADRLDLPISMV